MSLYDKLQARRQKRLAMRKAIDEKNARGFEKGIKLEKYDYLAIMISGLFSFVLPIMLVVGLACMLAYFLFSGFMF